jgi:hypothetical protein
MATVAARYNPSPFQQFAARMRGEPGWTNYELPSFHFTMVQVPNETAELLLPTGQLMGDLGAGRAARGSW